MLGCGSHSSATAHRVHQPKITSVLWQEADHHQKTKKLCKVCSMLLFMPVRRVDDKTVLLEF